jgi:hypothetical protein
MTKIYKQQPLRYLWPLFIVVSLVTALWTQFPWDLKILPPDSTALTQRASPKVAYISLDEASINQLVKRAASEWMMGAGSKGKRRSIDLTTLEASLDAPPPIYLDKGCIIPTEWQADNVAQVPVNIPTIGVPENQSLISPKKTFPKRDAINARFSSSLMTAKFQFQFLGDALKTITSPSGQCRFYLECNAAGDVEHILRLSPATQDTSIFERALMLGKAKTPASGWVDIDWIIRK